MLGLLVSLLCAGAFVASEYAQGGIRVLLLFVAVAAIHLRLRCDALVKSESAEANPHMATGIGGGEVVARVEDVLALFAAGCAAPSPWGCVLGGSAALLAVSTAHLRAFGGSLGFAEDCCGPFSRVQRMRFLMLVAVIAASEALWLNSSWSLLVGLALIMAGTAYTAARRTMRLAVEMQGR